MMARGGSNDNGPVSEPGKGSVTVSYKQSCHSLIVNAEFSWEAIKELKRMFVGLGGWQQIIQFQENEEAVREKRRAANDNIIEVRKAESLRTGERYAEGLKALCDEGYTRHDALSRIATSYGKGIKEIEMFISLFNRHEKQDRSDQIRVLMDAGHSVRKIADEVGVSPSTAQRIMASVRETADE